MNLDQIKASKLPIRAVVIIGLVLLLLGSEAGLVLLKPAFFS